jgi:hypothetical protein
MSATREVENGIVLNAMNGDSSVDQERGRFVSSTEQAVSSLPIMSVDYATSETLLQCLQKNASFVHFIRWSGNHWPESTEPYAWASKLYYHAVRGGLTVVGFFGIALVASSAVEHSTISALFWTAAVFDFLSCIPAQYLNQLRLQQPAHLLDGAVVDEGLRVTMLFLLASSGSIIFAFVVFSISIQGDPAYLKAINIITLIAQTFIASYLAFNLFFLVLDLQVSSLLLDQLDLLVDSKTLSMQKFNLVREDIHRRDKAGKWAADIIIIPCGASVLAIAMVLYNLELGRGAYGIKAGMALILLLLKEFFFLAIAFWYVAKVNGKADKLTVKISKALWCPVEGHLLPDVERLSIYASSVAEPISYTLLFKRVSWNNVILSGAGFAVTILVGIIKNLLGLSSS